MMKVARAGESYSDSALDLDALISRCLGRIELVDRVLGRFQQSFEQDLEQLEDAARAGDEDEIARLAHRIKGTSLTVSAQQLSESASRLEAAASAHDEMEALLAEFRRESARVREAVADSRRKGTHP